jgi:5-methyltetrahydropteroyltriglutamate--homocysteine methyltransferase
MFEVLEGRVLPEVTGPIKRGPLEYARLWKTAQRLTRAPVKFGAISSQVLAGGLHDNYYRDRRKLLMDMSSMMNEELHELADAGCPVVQIEEPSIHGTVGIIDDKEWTGDFLVEAFNREVRGLRDKAEVWCHTCWGNPAAQRTETVARSYSAALPYLNRLEVDVLTFEGAENRGEEFAGISRGISADMKICIGVISHRTLQVERPEVVAALIRKALQHIPAERLLVSTDCGFGRQGMSRVHAFYKMVSLVRGTNIVRKELGLPEADILAADPKGALISKPLARLCAAKCGLALLEECARAFLEVRAGEDRRRIVDLERKRLLDRHRGTAQARLDLRVRSGRPGCELASERLRIGQRLTVLGESIRQTDLDGALTGDFLREEHHVPRARHADPERQRPEERRIGHCADPHEGRAKARRARGDDEVAACSQPQACAVCGPLDGGDDRLVHQRDSAVEPGADAHAIAQLRFAQLAQGTQITAGGKAATGASDDHDAQRRVALQLRESGEHAVLQAGRTECVAYRWRVHD